MSLHQINKRPDFSCNAIRHKLSQYMMPELGSRYFKPEIFPVLLSKPAVHDSHVRGSCPKQQLLIFFCVSSHNLSESETKRDGMNNTHSEHGPGVGGGAGFALTAPLRACRPTPCLRGRQRGTSAEKTSLPSRLKQLLHRLSHLSGRICT